MLVVMLVGFSTLPPLVMAGRICRVRERLSNLHTNLGLLERCMDYI